MLWQYDTPGACIMCRFDIAIRRGAHQQKLISVEPGKWWDDRLRI